MTPEAVGGTPGMRGWCITVGVYHRVVELADRAEGFRPKNAKHFERIVPLPRSRGVVDGAHSGRKHARNIWSFSVMCGPEVSISARNAARRDENVRRACASRRGSGAALRR